MSLTEHYKTLGSDDLLALHQSGKLAEDSYPLLEAELVGRSLSVPSRPPDWVPEADERHFFAEHWRGIRPLWSAFWLLFVVGSKALLIVSYAAFSFVRGVAPNLGVFALLVVAIYLFAATIAVWRCSPNSSKVMWSWLARGITATYTLFFAYVTVLAFKLSAGA